MSNEYKPPVSVDRQHYENVVADLKQLAPEIAACRFEGNDFAVKCFESRKSYLLGLLGIDWQWR